MLSFGFIFFLNFEQTRQTRGKKGYKGYVEAAGVEDNDYFATDDHLQVRLPSSLFHCNYTSGVFSVLEVKNLLVLLYSIHHQLKTKTRCIPYQRSMKKIDNQENS